MLRCSLALSWEILRRRTVLREFATDEASICIDPRRKGGGLYLEACNSAKTIGTQRGVMLASVLSSVALCLGRDPAHTWYTYSDVYSAARRKEGEQGSVSLHKSVWYARSDVGKRGDYRPIGFIFCARERREIYEIEKLQLSILLMRLSTTLSKLTHAEGDLDFLCTPRYTGGMWKCTSTGFF